MEVTRDMVAVLKFGGGCHGIETTLRAKVPELTAVRDVTDHSTGKAPYIPA